MLTLLEIFFITVILLNSYFIFRILYVLKQIRSSNINMKQSSNLKMTGNIEKDLEPLEYLIDKLSEEYFLGALPYHEGSSIMIKDEDVDKWTLEIFHNVMETISPEIRNVIKVYIDEDNIDDYIMSEIYKITLDRAVAISAYKANI